MLHSFNEMKFRAPKAWLSLALLTPAALAVFFAAFCREQIATSILSVTLGAITCAGFIAGIYVAYRAKFNAQFGLWFLSYTVVIIECFFAGSAPVWAAIIANRDELRWPAFFCHVFLVLLTLFGGMCREWRAQGWRWGDMPQVVMKKWDKYIDYSNRLVNPLFTTRNSQPVREYKSALWVVGAAAANIPLLFELYGGGKTNAIFLAAPLLTGTLAYINITTLGPAFVRLILLRKLEKALGFQFKNSDYEQFQELRRSFFLARWLMKDYRPPQTESAAASEKHVVKIQRKQKRKR